MNIAIVFAGGSGVRMGAGIPKQFLEINGKSLFIPYSYFSTTIGLIKFISLCWNIIFLI